MDSQNNYEEIISSIEEKYGKMYIICEASKLFNNPVLKQLTLQELEAFVFYKVAMGTFKIFNIRCEYYMVGYTAVSKCLYEIFQLQKQNKRIFSHNIITKNTSQH